MDDKYQFKKLESMSSKLWHSISILRNSVFVSEQKCIYTDPDQTDALAIHCYLLNEESLVAYARLYQRDAWHIGRVITDENFRNRGHSSALLNSCISHINEHDENAQIELSSQAYLHDFYSKFGFVAKGSMYLEDGIPHLKMVYKRLE